MRPLIWFDTLLLAQRGHLVGWLPVGLAFGIGGYFHLTQEPGGMAISVTVAVLAGLLICARFVTTSIVPLLMFLVLVGLGAGLAKFRTDSVAGPILGFRYYGPVTGRLVDIDRSGSDAVRLTLDHVILDKFAPDRVPHRVRLSLHGDQPLTQFTPGDVIMATAHLSPPSGPAEPGGFDFQRHAWFAQIGAVGYTRNPVVRLAPRTAGGVAMWLFDLRMTLSTAIQARISGEAGAFAAAVVTGDRSGIAQVTLDRLRDANLAHLLAISGLHMGLLTGFVFAALRTGLALVPGLALRWPIKKIAAIVALFVASAYLALSGGNVATQRAFIMVAVMLVAVLLDKRALTLRAVAIAATIVLVLRPEALTGPGFQMSFAATTALVAVFGVLRGVDLYRYPKWARSVFAVVVSSLVAGLATAPYGAAHFNQIAHYGLLANVVSVPLMGVLVMPAAVVAACLAPFGLAIVGLKLMEWGLLWILWVAQTVAALPGSVSYVWAPGAMVLPLLTCGALWLILWQGRLRFAGLAGIVAAFGIWAMTPRPALIVAQSGSLMGLATAQGRAVSKPRGDGFAAGIWLENDGAPVAQDRAFDRPGFTTKDRVTRAALGGIPIVQVSGKTALAGLQGCGGAQILITNVADATTARVCQVFDIARLRDTGAITIDPAPGGGLFIQTARGVTGQRPWNPGPDMPAKLWLTPDGALLPWTSE